MSGSSRIEVRSRHFVLIVESARRRFSNSDDERRWHQRWRASVRAAKVPIERCLEQRADDTVSLVKYAKRLPLVEERQASAHIDAGNGPCRYRVPLRASGEGHITVAVASLPDDATRQALRRALGRAFRQGEP